MAVSLIYITQSVRPINLAFLDSVKRVKHKLFESFVEYNQYVFIYLYAHWDARSIFFSSLVKELACKYSSEVSFRLHEELTTTKVREVTTRFSVQDLVSHGQLL